MEEEIKEDGGYRSRKFWMTIIVMGMNGLIAGIAGYLGFEVIITPVVAANITALTVYCGTNVGTKAVAAGILKKKVEAVSDENK